MWSETESKERGFIDEFAKQLEFQMRTEREIERDGERGENVGWDSVKAANVFISTLQLGYLLHI